MTRTPRKSGGREWAMDAGTGADEYVWAQAEAWVSRVWPNA